MILPSLLNQPAQMLIMHSKDTTEEVVKSDSVKMGFVTGTDQKLHFVMQQV